MWKIKKWGYVSIEVVIAAAIILAFGLAGVTMINTKGSQLMSNGMDKLESLGLFGEPSGEGGIPGFNDQWYHDLLGITEGDVNPISDFTFVLNANGTSYTISAYNNTEDKTVVIPKFHSDGKTVTGIGDAAFRNMGLTSVALHNSIDSVGDYAFEGNELLNLYLSDYAAVAYAPRGIIYTSSELGASVSGLELGNYSFANNQLTNLNLANGLVSLGDSAFEHNNLETVLFPETVKELGSRAFLGNSIATVIIPASVTAVGNDTFKSNGLTHVTFEGTLPTVLGADIFSANNNLIVRTVAVPTGQVSSYKTAAALLGVPEYAIYDNSLPLDPNAYDGTWYDASLNIKESDINLTSDFTYTYNNTLAGWTITGYTNTTDKSVVLPKYHSDGRIIVEIGHYALADKDLTSAIIPNSVVSIGYESFGNNLLTSFIIPNSVTTIGGFAFRNNLLTSIIIPDSITLINNGVFLGNQLTSVIVPDSVTVIDSGAFKLNKLTSVKIGKRVRRIGGQTFMGNQLTTVEIPNSVTNIESYAFQDNLLTSVTLGEGVAIIGREAFLNNKLTSLVIPNSVWAIEDGAFTNNELTSVEFGSGLLEIRENLFLNNKLTSVTIPNSVSIICPNAFKNNQLTSVIIPDSITSIRTSAFENNRLLSVTIPGSVKTIESYSFMNNQLTSVTFSGPRPSLGTKVFNANDGLVNGSIWVPSAYLASYRAASFNFSQSPDDFIGY